MKCLQFHAFLKLTLVSQRVTAGGFQYALTEARSITGMTNMPVSDFDSQRVLKQYPSSRVPLTYNSALLALHTYAQNIILICSSIIAESQGSFYSVQKISRNLSFRLFYSGMNTGKNNMKIYNWWEDLEWAQKVAVEQRRVRTEKGASTSRGNLPKSNMLLPSKLISEGLGVSAIFHFQREILRIPFRKCISRPS